MSVSMDPGQKSAAEIEADVESSRARLTGTLDELRDRASPGQLFEQALDYAKGSGGSEFVQGLGRQVRDNPLPVLLIGAGIGWLMLSGRGGSAGPSGPASGSGAATGHPLPRLTGAYAAPQGDHGDGTLRESLSGAAGAVTETLHRGAHDLRDSVAEGAGALTRAAGETGDAARDSAARMGTASREGLDWVMREQPLLIGALGLAVGVAMGALLPSTDAEDRLMGQASDALGESASATIGQGLQRAREVLDEQLDRAGGDQKMASVGEAARGLIREAKGAITEPPPP